jgi:cyclic beta-1,2-glucan synthetase
MAERFRLRKRADNGRFVARAAEEPPLRAELFNDQQLQHHARLLAGWHSVDTNERDRRRPDRLLPRLASNEAALSEAYDLILDAVKRRRQITPASEWFLDNYHLIEEQIRISRRHLPKGFSRQLPVLTNGSSAGLPRVYDLALELISHVDGRIDADSLRSFVVSYESVAPLRLGELWAVPIMLRLALLENLRRVALRITAGRRDRERADYWVEQLVEVAGREPTRAVLVLADLVREDPPLTTAFVAEFATQLQGRGAAQAFPTTWLEHRLAEQNQTLEQIFQDASQNQAADQVSVGNSINSLRLLGAIEWRDFVEATSAVEHTLRNDPAQVYPSMDFATRDRYRHAIEEIARHSPMSEDEVARKAVELARQRLSAPSHNGSARADRRKHVGYYLIDRGRRGLQRSVEARMSPLDLIAEWARRFPLAIYLAAIAAITAGVTALALWQTARHGIGPWGLIGCGLLLAICTSQLAVALVHWAVAILIQPRLLPRMDFSHGIAPECRTIVAVPTMLGDQREIADLIESMEVRFLANRDPLLSFALLTDFRDAERETMPEDEAFLRQATDGISALNAKYGGGFFLFHRSRRWNPREGVWMGWERKRGKLEEFNGFLRGTDGKFDTIVGPVELLTDVKYVIALDSDTQLPRDTARQLIGTMAHPLNRPVYDEKLGRITEGYSILQPRVGVGIPSAGRSRFARLFAGEPGIDPYTRAVSDVYQDVFDEGSFIGKGIYDVDAFSKSVGGRLPENRILSHDLLEGAHARGGLVSDVVLFEDFPSAYPAEVSRRSRWIRGDWQITAWLLPRVPGVDGRAPNPISPLSRWKILDNLRRSLLPASLLALLILGLCLPGEALFFTGLVLGVMLIPPLLAGLAELARRPTDLGYRQHGRAVARRIGRQLLQELFTLACLPYDAFISLEAIGRTAVRVLVTRRKLLEWRTARDAQRTAHTDLAGFFRSMWVQPGLAALVLLGQALVRSRGMPIAGPLAALWLVSPAIAWWLSQPTRPALSRLSAGDELFLGAIARRTWRFFEAFFTATDNYLPPDNFQEDPPIGVAHRTSPTNIGLWLLSNLAACDFGYISAAGMIDRIGRTLATMDKLSRHRGHFYNWYDTRTLEPLRPLYISTVDSGNLAGHLLTLAAGLEEMGHRKICPPAVFKGIGQTLDEVVGLAGGREADSPAGQIRRLREPLQTPPRTLSGMYLLMQHLAAGAEELGRAAEMQSNDQARTWLRATVDQCRSLADELKFLAPWVELPSPGGLAETSGDMRELLRRLDEVPTPTEIAKLEETLRGAIDSVESPAASDWLGRLGDSLAVAAEHATKRISDLREMALHCRELGDIEFEFLYDNCRRLLAIGYDVGEHRRDSSFYDLLASEARVASFVAIAQGKLPQDNWFSLGRLLTSYGGKTALVSWSGSMFEYLMPLLIMPTYEHTLLDETYRAVVDRQIRYGRERGVPWGVSESGYNKTDAQLNYQYSAFGVPGMGLKRGLANDLVIAPYATVMALMVDPKSSCTNLRRLADEKRLGAYGFYEAIDYTASRLPPDQTSVTVKSFMAHHQGMSFLSLAYILLDRPMQRRFESDPAFRATDLLLQERVPNTPVIFPHPAEVSEARGTTAESPPNLRVFKTPSTPTPEVHLLSNGRYHVAVTAAGGGYSRWRDLAVTRWREDATRDCWGMFCYMRDVENNEFWSAAYQPTLRRGTSYEAIYSQGRAEYRRRDGDIDTHVEISVSPEDDIELRRINIVNRGKTARVIELTSYAEVVLASSAADLAHPAFSNLFVQTQLVRPRQAILCTRRPRSVSEKPPWMMHLMKVDGNTRGAVSYETDRAKFVGRGRTPADPAAMYSQNLSDSEGAVLDPIISIRNTIALQPDETARVNFVTGVAETREAAMGLIEKYSDSRLADRVFDLAWTHSQVVLRQLDAGEGETQLYGRMAGSILYANPRLRAPGSVIARNRKGQSGLWGYGISGDLPIVLLRIADRAQTSLVRQMVAAHAYWRVKGLAVDLVIWNDDQSSYRQALQDMILGVIGSSVEASLMDKPGGIFVRRVEQMSEEDKILFQTVARVVVSDTAGTLAQQLERPPRAEIPVPRFSAARGRRGDVPMAVEVPERDLAAFNGMGGFTRDGKEYVITTTPEKPTPAPWINVMANPWFGTIVSESGGAYTWCENAQTYRLTPWHNDAVSDVSGEAFYLRDEETGRFWSPTPLPARGAMPYTTRHGFGYTVFEYTEGGITSEMKTYVATDAPVKFIVLKIRNGGERTRRISLTGFFEMVLGERRPAGLPHVVTEVDVKTGAMLASNPYATDFAERVAFLECSESQRTVTGDRAEFLGRNGSPQSPACMSRSRLSGRVGAGLDPCLSMQAILEIPPGEEREAAFIFGSGQNLADARNLVYRFRGLAPARAALESVWQYWGRTLGAVHVETPDDSLNFLVNGWLLYQVLASRVWGRSGFYQSGGAFGFRDQLQDVMSLVHADPAFLRAHLLRCAGRQFKEGDVQHWWHLPTGRGVRTHISDDYLWLPYATCRYVTALGDVGVLDEKINFIEGRAVKPDEEGYYDLPVRSEEAATLYEHCVRAIRHGLKFGEHGLPLMGSGDWNDGMNLVGEHGKGESVWLAFFLHDVLTQFAEIARGRHDSTVADLCIAEAAKLRTNIEQNAWDGQWYRRAYFDDGEPLGSATNDECRIDSLPQSWAVLSGAGDLPRSGQALEQLNIQLVKRDIGVIQLFDPPFDHSHLNPGYVKGYVPGVRENGGQYTHAAVWSVMAFAQAGQTERAWELFSLLNPVRHGDSESAIERYKVEPYVIAADVYTNPQHAGRGGWTWYTGSAGWMYRLITESLLGLRLEVNHLRLTPSMPGKWDSFTVHYRYRETFHHIHFRKIGGGGAVSRVTFDGTEQPDKTIPLLDDRQEHHIEVEMGG